VRRNALSEAEVGKLMASYPRCRWCKKPVCGGQVDGEGVPSHYTCQLAFLSLSKPHPRAVAPNPKLPQVHHQK
jgi:hypothetical protein